jgi:hypothetical protein
VMGYELILTVVGLNVSKLVVKSSSMILGWCEKTYLGGTTNVDTVLDGFD